MHNVYFLKISYGLAIVIQNRESSLRVRYRKLPTFDSSHQFSCLVPCDTLLPWAVVQGRVSCKTQRPQRQPTAEDSKASGGTKFSMLIGLSSRGFWIWWELLCCFRATSNSSAMDRILDSNLRCFSWRVFRCKLCFCAALNSSPRDRTLDSNICCLRWSCCVF